MSAVDKMHIVVAVYPLMRVQGASCGDSLVVDLDRIEETADFLDSLAKRLRELALARRVIE